MFHNSQAVLAISKEPNPTVFQKTLGVNDYYFASDAWEFPMGNIQMVGESVPAMYRGEKPVITKLAPFGLSLKEVAEHAIDFWLSTEDLPAGGEPRHPRRRGEARRSPTAEQRHGPRPPAHSCARCSASSACTSTT